MYSNLLKQRYLLSRYTSTTVDDYNQPVKTWVTSSTAVACQLATIRAVEIEVEKQVVITSLKLYTLSSSDLTFKDRVVIDSLTYEVLAPIPVNQNHHKEFYVRLVK
jgi:hypothetical protein